jgi:hypothetical protein
MVSNYNFGGAFGALPDVIVQLSQVDAWDIWSGFRRRMAVT